MINEFVTNKVLAKTLTESIGKKEISSLAYVGNKKDSIAIKIDQKNKDEALLQGEFLRYLVDNEEITFVCMAIKGYCITPEDSLKMSEKEVEEIKDSPLSIANSKYVKETLQINVESKISVRLSTYEVIKNSMGLIFNLKEIEEMRLEGTIKSLGISSDLSDFFTGLKTDLLLLNPHITKIYKERSEKLMAKISE